MATSASGQPPINIEMIKAIFGGDLDKVRELLNEHPDLVYANIIRNCSGDQLAIYKAIALGKLEIVNELLSKMSNEDLETKRVLGSRYTVLHAAALYKGKTKIAQLLLQKCEELLSMKDWHDEIALIKACVCGHEDMIHYLYSRTKPENLLKSENIFQAQLAMDYCIGNKTFDVALDLLNRHPDLAVYGSVIRALSRQTSAFLSTSGLSFWQSWVYSCLKVEKPNPSIGDIKIYIPIQDQMATNSFNLKGKLLALWSNVLTLFGIKQIYDLKLKHAYARELLLLISEAIVGLDASQISQIGVDTAIFNAAQHGMTEFIVEIIKANLDLLWLIDGNCRNIFQCAVVNRQERTFSLIYGQDFMKIEFSSSGDSQGNAMLHMAAQLSDYSRLAQISGPALQMQRELQWYKEVGSIVQNYHVAKRITNVHGKTPDELFNASHAAMVKEGEKWMKDIAQSSTIVGTLIITIMFAALYTVPGGNNQDTGIPIFLSRTAFEVFVISDAISLFASSTSVLMSVGILTSRYTANDFLQSLPTKLIIALSSLFISITTMMMAFCSTVIIMLKGRLAMVIPIVLLATIPVSIFMWSQFPLLVNTIISTYGPGIFNRKMKNWLI